MPHVRFSYTATQAATYAATCAMTALGLVGACTQAPRDQPVACTDDGRCLSAGTSCVDGFCVPAGGGGGGGPNTYGAAGGVVIGDDGVRLGVPAGALQSQITFAVLRQSSSAPTPGIIALSRVYAIGPGGTAFDAAAEVIIPFASSALPEGRIAAEAAVFHSTSLGGPYVALEPGAPQPGSATGLTPSLSYFVAGLAPIGGPDDDSGGEGGSGGSGGQGGTGGDDSVVSNPGPTFGRSCTADPDACSGDDPVCFFNAAGDATGGSTCTGACQYFSDCPVGSCCQDTQGRLEPSEILCVPTGDGCGPPNPTIPRRRPCTDTSQCKRGAACVLGECYQALPESGLGGAALPGDPCSGPLDCDLDSSATCAHRLPDGAWRVGDASDAISAAYSACAPECGSDGDCPADMCCRLADRADGLPLAICVESTGEDGAANCGGERAGLYESCSFVDPSTCDAATTDQCIYFVFEDAAGQYCSHTCASDADCAGGTCCALEAYGASFCISGDTACQ